jgi:hypothetical protein
LGTEAGFRPDVRCKSHGLDARQSCLQVRNGQFDETGNMVEVGHRFQPKLNPMRILGSLRMVNRIGRLHQVFACDDPPRQVQIEFFVMVKMREGLVAIAKCGKAIIATREWPFLNAELSDARDQLFA